jgi:hypothetical protein
MVTRRPDGVFVSSVYNELRPYRRAAIDAIWRAGFHPIGMEREDIARFETTTESSFKMLDESSVYVGIFAQRYGAVTIEELHYAQDLGLPILAFIAEEQLNQRDVEPDPERAQALAAIKQELRDHYVVATFRTWQELGGKVLRSLHQLVEDGKLAAIHPTQQAPVERLPTPPQPYYAHPYTAGSRFVGRKAELALLDAWATSADPTLIVEAIGGSGKSALTWEWVHQPEHLPRLLPERAGLVWWSFYESQATVGKFLAHTLAYLTGRPVEACAQLPRSVQEEQLLIALRGRAQPVLLVLDGVERLLLAYHRHDAAHLADSVVEGERRRCTDPRDGTLLRQLTLAAPAKVLITSRLIPQDLQTRNGQLVQGVRHLPLLGLSGEDALALLAEEGVRGDAMVMRNFLAQFGDHALLIQVLAGRIRDYRPAPGDFDAWYRAVGGNLQLSEQDLVSRQASILQAALEDLDPLVFRLLSQLAAFRYPVDYEAVVAINLFRIEEMGDDRAAGVEPLHQALTTLEERGLLQWNREINRYDMHPVVRAYAYGKLEDKAATYAQVKSYFEALPEENEEQVQDVADLRRTLELYYALLNGGQPKSALELFDNRIEDILLFGLGGYTTLVELLSPLFANGFDQPPMLPTINSQSYAINELALAFQHLGDAPKALQLYALGTRLDLQDQHAGNLAEGLGNLGGLWLNSTGQLAAAERAFQLRLAVARAADEQEKIDRAYEQLVEFYSTTGAWAEGEAFYAALQNSPDEFTKSQQLVFIAAARLRWGQGDNPATLLAEGLQRARQERFLRAEREAQHLAGEIAFACDDLAQAEEAWQAAYTIAQREGAPLGPSLADLARVQSSQQDAEQARALLGEALVLGGRGVALAAVEVFTALGEQAEARRHVEAAYREAWADGPPYAYFHELGRIRAALQILGMPEPQLPPFDRAKVAPIPYEAEILAFIEELKRERGDSSPEVSQNGHSQQNGKPPWWQFWSRR